MAKKQGLKTNSLDEITDKHIGKRDTAKREAFENELRLELLGEAIKQARIKRNLTQEELGWLVGVQKEQISKLENCLLPSQFKSAYADAQFTVIDTENYLDFICWKIDCWQYYHKV